MKDCIFCKIVKGEIPCHKVYEDDYVLSFLDITPRTEGHTLVIPKKHYENIYELPDEEIGNYFKGLKKTAMILKKKLNARGMNILNNNGEVAGQFVFHLHFHLLPKYEKGKELWPEEGFKGSLEETMKKLKS